MPFRPPPPVLTEKGFVCWAYALASFKWASLGEPCWPNEILDHYKQYTGELGELIPSNWPLIADEEQLKYKILLGSNLERHYVRVVLEGYYIYAVEDRGGNFSHAYVIYGVGGYSDPFLAVMDPMQDELSRKYFFDIQRSKLMIAAYALK